MRGTSAWCVVLAFVDLNEIGVEIEEASRLGDIEEKARRARVQWLGRQEHPRFPRPRERQLPCLKYFFLQYNFTRREPNSCQEVHCTSRPSGIGLTGYSAAYFLLLTGGSAERSGVLRSTMEVQYARRAYFRLPVGRKGAFGKQQLRLQY